MYHIGISDRSHMTIKNTKVKKIAYWRKNDKYTALNGEFVSYAVNRTAIWNSSLVRKICPRKEWFWLTKKIRFDANFIKWKAFCKTSGDNSFCERGCEPNVKICRNETNLRISSNFVRWGIQLRVSPWHCGKDLLQCGHRGVCAARRSFRPSAFYFDTQPFDFPADDTRQWALFGNDPRCCADQGFLFPRID